MKYTTEQLNHIISNTPIDNNEKLILADIIKTISSIKSKSVDDDIIIQFKNYKKSIEQCIQILQKDINDAGPNIDTYKKVINLFIIINNNLNIYNLSSSKKYINESLQFINFTP